MVLGQTVTCWRSKDGGRWEQCEIGARSIVAWQLGQIGGTEIVDDGYGNRYRMASPDLMGEQR